MTRRPVTVAGAVLALSVFGVGAPASAQSLPAGRRPSPDVTGGSPDGGAHPYVAMVLAPGASRPGCTGVLVRADDGAAEVLTDAHCLARGGVRHGTGVGVTFAPTWSRSAPVVRGTFHLDPLYAPAVSQHHDLAVITLAAGAVAGSTAARLVGLGGSALAAGTTVTVVGTGTPHAGQRRQATEVVQGLTPDWVVLDPGTGNSCDGDSGGPDLLPGTSTVVALTDQGTCYYDLDTPLGTPEAHWFASAASTAPADRAVREPSLLGLRAVRSGSTVVVHGSSRFLDITTGHLRGWPGNQIVIQRWSRSGWLTLRTVTTDRDGNLVVPLRIPFVVGLRLTTEAGTSIGGAVSVPTIA